MTFHRLLTPLALGAAILGACKSNTISNSNSSNTTIGPSGVLPVCCVP
jgi:hypothetical protein